LQLDSVGATLQSPFDLRDPTVIARGEVVFETQCSACHGPAGAGDGPILGAGKFPYAPAINSAATAARSDGYIYGVIDVGRGLMPPYGEKIAHLDRWAVVAFVRELERRAAAPAPAGAAPAAAAPAATAPPAP
jgi:mono/diheme cytochrome c family protein